MLKKKILTETIYNNGDPFQIREAISATIGAWQKREDVQVLWGTLKIYSGEIQDPTDQWGYLNVIDLQVEAVYDASN